MAPITNSRVIFNEIPKGHPEPGKTTVYDSSQTIDLETVPLSGGFLIKTLVLSIDPYQRGKMRAPTPGSYTPPYLIGETLYNFGVGVVLRSETPGVKQGDHVYGQLKFQEYSVIDKLEGLRIIEKYDKLPWSVFVGALGMPGQTAYVGWAEHADPQKGDTVFVSTGAGPVGSLVVQLAKLEGLKVIASAGSDEKVEFLKSIGVDVPFNYKTTPTREVLKKEGPINIYWDHVGGETLEAALDAAAVDARFIECGMISGYNEGPQPIRNMTQVLVKSLHLHGLIGPRLMPKHGEKFFATIPPKLANGEIKYLEDVRRGLDKAGEALLAVQKGTNVGKCVIWLADDSSEYGQVSAAM